MEFDNNLAIEVEPDGGRVLRDTTSRALRWPQNQRSAVAIALTEERVPEARRRRSATVIGYRQDSCGIDDIARPRPLINTGFPLLIQTQLMRLFSLISAVTLGCFGVRNSVGAFAPLAASDGQKKPTRRQIEHVMEKADKYDSYNRPRMTQASSAIGRVANTLRPLAKPSGWAKGIRRIGQRLRGKRQRRYQRLEDQNSDEEIEKFRSQGRYESEDDWLYHAGYDQD
ncbi:hypothetical protein FOZ62_012257 [Perkinsus olseni]|uniref:Uncharacterized protein n=1 Tax=Perkinsus olseni TaxID=32597 RepID=A0A7J6RVA4_PEROL|nr:hypothetical protein FOZ62_012257 [Perkinsus olseni]